MDYQKYVDKVMERLNQRILGKEQQIRLLIIALLSKGHVLLEDVPGVGKTTLAVALAKTMDLSFGRIQFTPDTLPSDITGVSIYHLDSGEFSYRSGPIMNQIILADEINRTSPKTQASLLEAMAEGQVSVDGTIYPLPTPFMVIATQNPIDFLGTYQLPEAQLDRFFMRLSLGYPDREHERIMAKDYLDAKYQTNLEPLINQEIIQGMQQEVERQFIHPDIVDYIVSIVEETRKQDTISLGASPRATLFLLRAAQGCAYLSGRNYVLPDDVKEIAAPVLCHRIMVSVEARVKKITADKVLKEILLHIPVPVLSKEALCGKTD